MKTNKPLPMLQVLSILYIFSGCQLQHRHAPLQEKQLAKGAITFITEGAIFSPKITLSEKAQVRWTWADGSTDTTLKPFKFYGLPASRINTLHVVPWSALKGINLGYNAEDGGSSSIENNSDQHVSAVENLKFAAPYLKQWCSSFNCIPALDFNDFVKLETIECYHSGTLKSVKLHDTPLLKRICLEGCNISELDVSDCPVLEDIRGACNKYPTIKFGSAGKNLWHICIRDNPQITNQTIFGDMIQFPQISELFIWNDHQSGILTIHSTSSDRDVSIQGSGNSFTTLNFFGALKNRLKTGVINFAGNPISEINISGCEQITELNLKGNHLFEKELDQVLINLDSSGRKSGDASCNFECDLRGMADCTGIGIIHARNLAKKGWIVLLKHHTFRPEAMYPVTTILKKTHSASNPGG